MRHFTVTQLNRELGQLLDSRYNGIEVEGEIDQISVPASGHAYLVLRDRQDTISAVVWQDAWRQLTSGPKKPQRGDRVVCRGRMGVFGRKGSYQLYVNTMRPAGQGKLAAELAERKARLESEGLLDPRRRRPLPTMPRFVGVATSMTGAALQDFLKVSRHRFGAARILVANCVVQGDMAPASVVQAVDLLLEDGRSEVVVIMRGGGSKDDLLAFHDEQLCRWMAHAPIPIVSAVGHQVDTTLLDLVADAVAATPSDAAMVVLPDGEGLRQAVDDAAIRLERSITERITEARTQVRHHAERLRHPADRVARVREQAIALESRLATAAARSVHEARLRARTAEERLLRLDLTSRRRQRLLALTDRLAALSPTAVLDRGYAIVSSDHGVVRSISQVIPGISLSIRLQDGTATAMATEGTP